jgi:molybdate transport system substrate-binding protein
MRKVLLGVFALVLASPALAQATELNVLAPGVVYNAGLLDLAAAYTKDTGIKVTVKSDGMAAIVNDIKKGTPIADVIALPVAFMDGMEAESTIEPGSRATLGRVYVGLAVKKGAAHPDISTPKKLGDALRKGGVILYSNPASGSMVARIINDMLYRYPELKGVHWKIAVGHEGGEGLIKGEGDMALQLICEIVNHPELELVDKLPVSMGGYIDTAVAVSARSVQVDAAKAFVTYITQPEHKALWMAKGLERE